MTHSRIGKVRFKNGTELRIPDLGKVQDNDTTDVLMEGLSMARKGEMVAVGIAGVLSDGQIITAFSADAGKCMFHVLSSAELLKDRIINEVVNV